MKAFHRMLPGKVHCIHICSRAKKGLQVPPGALSRSEYSGRLQNLPDIKAVSLFVAFLLFCFFPAAAQAKPLIINSDFKSSQLLGEWLEYLEDPSTELKIEQAAGSRHWQKTSVEIPNFGYSSSAYWFRFAVNNVSAQDFNGILELQYPILDFVEFFLIDQQGELLKHEISGDMLPFSERKIHHRNHLFALELRAGEQRFIYIRIHTDSSVQVPIVVWQETSFWIEDQKTFAMQALYFGFMTAMIVYNSFIFLAHRFLSYLWYVLFVFSFAAFQFNLHGLGMQFVWPESPNWNRLSLPLFISSAVLFACVFTNSFLKVRNHSKILHFLLKLGIAVYLTLIGLSLLLPASLVVRMSVAFSIVMCISCLLSGISAWRGKNPLGVYFTAAWVSFLIGTILAALNKFGFVERNVLTEFSSQFGSALEVALLSFALAYRMNLVNKEKLQAQQQAYQVQEELIRVQKEANSLLEQKVAERTAQLNQKTANLSNMLQHLHQGVLMIGPEGKIHHEYSSYLESILEHNSIADKDAVELLFANSSLTADQVSEIKTAIEFSLGTDDFNFETNRHLLVRSFQKTMADGRVKDLELDWNPVMFESGSAVDQIMVTIRDVTEVKEFKKKAEEKSKELDIISKIIDARLEKFVTFIQQAKSYLEESDEILLANKSISQGHCEIILRNLHTLKGNARVFGFDVLASCVHEVEEHFSKLKSQTEKSSSREFLRGKLSRIQTELRYYFELYQNKLQNLIENQDSKLVKELRSYISDLLQQFDSSSKLPVSELHRLYHMLESSRLENILETLIANLAELAGQLGKPAPKLSIIDNAIRIPNRYSQALQDVFVHLLRNALDHGIEAPDQRLRLGKPAYGQIKVSLQQLGDDLVLTCSDDGRGLNLLELHEKGNYPSALNPDKIGQLHEIASSIFQAGVSTAEQLSEISGRGVGLEAVKEFLNQHNCEIDIQLAYAGDLAHCPFSFVIKLPLKQASAAYSIDDAV